MKYYVIKNRPMPWGNYGEMLWQGISIYDKNVDSHFILRTGEPTEI